MRAEVFIIYHRVAKKMTGIVFKDGVNGTLLDWLVEAMSSTTCINSIRMFDGPSFMYFKLIIERFRYLSLITHDS